MTCNCDCHKQDNFNKLKKCEDRNKTKDKKIKKLEKQVLTLTLVAAIIGTLVGKEALDSVLEWFDGFNEVKTVITDTITSNDPFIIDSPQTYGESPSPSTLALFGLFFLKPVGRRK